jgi:hypothetical protein
LEAIFDFSVSLAFGADFAAGFALDKGLAFCFCLAIGVLAQDFKM